MNIKRDYVTTFATEAVVIASYLFTFRLVANRLGPAGFGEYALARRVLSLIAPLALLGADLAVTRLVAYTSVVYTRRAGGYAAAALGIMFGALVPFTVLLVVLRAQLALLLFGSEGYAPLVLSLPVLLLGSGLHGISYGYLRGRMRIRAANVLMAINYGVVPILAVFVGATVAHILLGTGLGWTVVSLTFLAASGLRLPAWGPQVSEIMRFGIPRVPGNLLQLGLFASPGVIVAHVSGIRAAGVVAFGIATLGMIGSALTPVGFVLLPVATRMVARGAYGNLRAEVLTLLRMTMPPLVIGMAVVEVFAGSIIGGYLGPVYVSGTVLIRIILLGSLPWGVYVLLRTVLDARYVRAINARNTLMACLAFGTGAIIGGAAGYAAVGTLLAFVGSLYILALLTIRDVSRAIKAPTTSGAVD